MLKIEIWKCRPSWLGLPGSERSTIVKRFAAVVQRRLSDPVRLEGGPFLLDKRDTALLIWTWDTTDGELARAYEELGISTHFEPLVDVRSSPGLTAKALADRLV
jgi:hypothetical protein